MRLARRGRRRKDMMKPELKKSSLNSVSFFTTRRRRNDSYSIPALVCLLFSIAAGKHVRVHLSDTVR